MVFGRPGLDEILSHVSRLQAENVILLNIVAGLGGQRVVEMYHIGAVRRAFVAVLVTVHVQRHVTQSRVEHFPASATKCSCKHQIHTNSTNQSVSIDTLPSRLYARLCHAFLVLQIFC